MEHATTVDVSYSIERAPSRSSTLVSENENKVKLKHTPLDSVAWTRWTP